MAGQKRRQLMLDCEICGEPVVLQPSRYVELVRLNEKPRCRKNGCERLCGSKNAGAARMPESLAVLDVQLRRVHWRRRKKGNANGALAKMAVSTDQTWHWKAAVAADEKDEV